jgi:TRAP transporter TAXI family solute receptor
MQLDDLGTKSYGSITENGELIKNRQAVGMGWYTVVPASFVLDVGSSRKLRMVGLTEDTIKKMQALNAGFVRHVIPKGTYNAYGIEEDVVTIQAPTILIASSKAPADAIYKVTKAIVEGREAFANVSAVMKGTTPKHFAESFGMPRHPGAERYYREAGLLK